jgi:phage terminase large subunit-like protein
VPDGDWSTWLILAGRGYGKTRTGAETVRRWIKEGFRYVNIIGPTAESIHDDLITGPGGIMTVCPDAEKPR